LFGTCFIKTTIFIKAVFSFQFSVFSPQPVFAEN
jgi:hypothetical protein